MGYKQGEYDVEFKDGEMHIGTYISKDLGSHGFGKIKFNTTDNTFEVNDWESDPDIWSGSKMFGVYKPLKGE